MGNTEPKNTKKLTVIITYSIAVVCLLLGLLLPFYYGKGVDGMLVMQLPDALGIFCAHKINLGNAFSASMLIYLFGIEKLAVDVTAYAVVLYAFITLLALLALIPMGLTFKKSGKVTRVLAYVIEIAAVLVLSIYLIMALQYAEIDKLPQILNIWVAFGGALLMLIIQCFVNKDGKTAAIKLVLLLLAIASLGMLFRFYQMTPDFYNGWIKLADNLKSSPDLYSILSGMDHVNAVFADNFIDILSTFKTAADVTMVVLGAIVGVFTLLNFFVDVIGLSNNLKRKGLIFNTVRYGIPFLAAICLFITVAVAKETEGLALSLLFIIVAIQLAINLGILIAQVVKSKKTVAATVEKSNENENKEEVSDEQPLEYGVNDYANFERRPEPAEAQVPDYSEDPEPEPKPYRDPYANPYAQPFGYDQPSYLDPFASAKFETRQTEIQQPAPAPEPEPEPPVRKKPAPSYDPTLGYPPEYLKNAPEYQPPVQEYNPVQDYRNYQPVQDYQPAKQPVQKETPKPEPTVHNVYSSYPPTPGQEQPAEQRVYKVNTVYQGPTDEFLRKLTNDEKIEFAMIFIEKSKGEIGRVPDYAIGGDNKKFFSSVFIYLGRIRGIISDGLLNKMYKEINMFK